MKTSINEMIKDLFKEKTIAHLNRYQAGQIFYRFELDNNMYEFAIDTVTPLNDEGDAFGMSEDLGTTAFGAEVRASELTRWIKARAMVSELKKLTPINA